MIGEIEQEIITLLQGIETATYGWQFADVHSYTGNYNDETIKSLYSENPTAFVGYAGDYQNPQSEGSDAIRVFANFRIAIIHSNLSNERSTRLGTDDAVGIYQMLTDIRVTLTQKAWELKAERLRVGTMSAPESVSLGSGSNAVLMSLDFQTSFTQPLLTSSATDFTILDTIWQQPLATELTERILPHE